MIRLTIAIAALPLAACTPALTGNVATTAAAVLRQGCDRAAAVRAAAELAIAAYDAACPVPAAAPPED